MDPLRPVKVDSPLDRRVRAFLGIGPPPEEWLDALEAWLVPVTRRLNGPMKWTKRENLHVTLRFFGNISQGDVLEIEAILRGLCGSFQHFRLDASRLLFFPNLERARIVGFKADDESRQIFELEKQIRERLAQFGKPPDTRPFHPHFTLARVDALSPGDRNIFRGLISERGGPKLPEWMAREVTLFESRLQAGGSVYTPIAKFPLVA